MLLVGAGLLFYFFVLRGPKDDDDGELPPPDGGEGPDGGPGGNGPSSGAGGDTMEDIFSGAAMDKLQPPVPYTPRPSRTWRISTAPTAAGLSRPRSKRRRRAYP